MNAINVIYALLAAAGIAVIAGCAVLPVLWELTESAGRGWATRRSTLPRLAPGTRRPADHASA